MNALVVFYQNKANAPWWTIYPHVGVDVETYRTKSYHSTYAKCFISLFAWHSETLNAWTMICHGIVLLATCAYLASIANFFDFFLKTHTSCNRN